MALQRQEQPPAYSHDPEYLDLPSVPRHELFPSHATAPPTLPPLKSMGLLDPVPTRHSHVSPDVGRDHALPPNFAGLQQWQPRSPLQYSSFPQVPSSAPKSSAGLASPMESVMSYEERSYRDASVVSSRVDPAEGMAAEALLGLKNFDLGQSPSTRSMTLPLQSNSSLGSPKRTLGHQEPEPLLQLLTSSHPWVGNTINGSISAYSTTKEYLPSFIRSGAESVERNIGSPMARTVESVSRRTGVDNSIRRYLGGRKLSDYEGDDSGHKRRRMISDNQDADVEKGIQPPVFAEQRSRAESQTSFASLPAYDNERSPQYEELGAISTPEHAHGERPQRNRSWGAQLVITTSGLGVAMSEKSLWSLKHCLNLLHTYTSSVTNLMRALKMLLDDYERSAQSSQQNSNAGAMEGVQTNYAGQPSTTDHDEESRRVADRIKVYSENIWNTLKKASQDIASYTGAALPENARALVRRQLLSVHWRWRIATESTANSSQTGSEAHIIGARQMLAFAKEGLNMMAQVSLVVDGTVVSAERWLDSLGRGRKEQSGQQHDGMMIKSENMFDTPAAAMSPTMDYEKPKE